MRSFRSFFAALTRSTAGNILPLSALAIFAVAALIGGAVDISRGWRVQTRLQAACDAGVLAGRRAVAANGFDQTASTQAETYFYANFNAGKQGAADTTFIATSVDRGSTVSAVATTQLPPIIMQLFGFAGFELRSTCTASMEVNNSDLMMVLDTTGSMNWALTGGQTRIQALRASMKSFYDTVAAASSGTTARVRYGFVPYSSSVNVGSLIRNLNANYLVDSATIQSRQAIYRSVQTVSGYGPPSPAPPTSVTSIPTYTSWTDHSASTFLFSSTCFASLPADTAWTNSGPATSVTTTAINGAGQQITTTTTTQVQTMTDYNCNWLLLFFKAQRRTGTRTVTTTVLTSANPIYATSQVFDRWEYRPVTYGMSDYKNFQTVSTNTGDNGAAVASTWRGCIEERSTVASDDFQWSPLTGFTTSDALDINIDTPPDGSNSSKWTPIWPEVAYIRTTTDGFGNVYMNNAMPSPTGQQAFSFCPSPARLLAPMDRTSYFAYADALVPEGSTYHDIGMIWGARLLSPDGLWSDNVRDPPLNGGQVSQHMIFMTDGEMAPNYSIQSAWGMEYHDRRVTDDGVTGDAQRHNSRFLAVCEAVKAKGIRLWVIAFASNMTQELATCASSDSAFPAENASQLDEAFQNIARQVGELRVVQ